MTPSPIATKLYQAMPHHPQRAHDAKRDRFMALHGWTTMRFTGGEIWADAAGCVGEIEAMVKRRWWWVFWG